MQFLHQVLLLQLVAAVLVDLIPLLLEAVLEAIQFLQQPLALLLQQAAVAVEALLLVPKIPAVVVDQAAEVIVQEVLVIRDQETLLPLLVLKVMMGVIQVEEKLEVAVEKVLLQLQVLQAFFHLVVQV